MIKENVHKRIIKVKILKTDSKNITILDKEPLIEVKIISKMIMNIKGAIIIIINKMIMNIKGVIIMIMIIINKTDHNKIDSNK